LTNGSNGDLVGSESIPLNPLLGPLANNGGATLSFALLPGSPAIDAGDDSLTGPPANLMFDQRGQPRKSGAHVDIGALEYDGMIDGVVQSPLLTGALLGQSGWQFSFNGTSGLGYSVLTSTNLHNWIFLASATEISRGWFIFQDTAATNGHWRFYKVRQP
jgi:hypothetical protein